MTCGVVMIIVLVSLTTSRHLIGRLTMANCMLCWKHDAPWYGLSVKGVAYRVSVFSLNVFKPSNLSFSFTSTIHTIKTQFASKLIVGFQNILRKNPLPLVSLVLPRVTCLVIEGGTKPACNQWLLLVSNPGIYYL